MAKINLRVEQLPPPKRTGLWLGRLQLIERTFQASLPMSRFRPGGSHDRNEPLEYALARDHITSKAWHSDPRFDQLQIHRLSRVWPAASLAGTKKHRPNGSLLQELSDHTLEFYRKPLNEDARVKSIRTGALLVGLSRLDMLNEGDVRRGALAALEFCRADPYTELGRELAAQAPDILAAAQHARTVSRTESVPALYSHIGSVTNPLVELDVPTSEAAVGMRETAPGLFWIALQTELDRYDRAISDSL